MVYPDKVIKDAVKEAQHTLTEYVQPGERSAKKTVEKLLDTLDNNDLNEAINESDRADQHEPMRHEKAS
jgi:hypothetical protein